MACSLAKTELEIIVKQEQAARILVQSTSQMVGRRKQPVARECETHESPTDICDGVLVLRRCRRVSRQRYDNNNLPLLVQVVDYQKQLRELDAEQGNRLGIFNAVQLNNLINQNIRRFRQRPIGPIGVLLTVTDST
jgi:hypothetical protein